jgi:hypothetical protein
MENKSRKRNIPLGLFILTVRNNLVTFMLLVKD